MTHAEVTTTLRQFNEWRRSDYEPSEQPAPPDPRVIGEAIDAAVEMIDRLEAAESECLEEARLNGIGSEREAALMAKLEAAENDAAHQKALAESALRVAEGWERKCGELRARIEQMEKQEPLYLFRRKGLDDFCTCSKERYEAFSANPRLFEVKKIYALPGAQPAPSVPDSIIADAARYQFLRNGGAYLEPNEGEIYMATDYGAKYYKDLRDLDMDIDEAIEAAPEAKK